MSKQYKTSSLKRNKFSLILSGGSSLGLAHIGTIKFLEEKNLVPSEIIGTSIGSIIGALYATGNTSEEIQEKLKGLKTQDLFEIKYLQGKVEYKKAKTLLKKMLSKKKISETKIPLKIITTNIKNGEKKIFTKKDNISIYDAVLASSAIPGILSAIQIKNEFYVDGCVSSNLPIEVAKKTNIKLAINVINRKTKNYNYHPPKKGLINNLILKFQVLKNVSRYYMENQTEAKIPTTSKLILIEPDMKNFNPHKIDNYKKIIQIGYLETKKYFNKAKKKTQKRKYISSMEKIITFPIKNTRRIIRNIKKL